MLVSREEFHSLAKEYRAIPVARELLADLTTPVSIYLRCATKGNRSFILESVESDLNWGRYSFVGRNPHACLISNGNEVTIEGSLPINDIPTDEGILKCLEYVIDFFSIPDIPNLPPFSAGFVGYFGFDVVGEIERIKDFGDSEFPSSILHLIGDLAIFDHWQQRVTLVSVAILPEDPSDQVIDMAYDDAISRLEDFAFDGSIAIAEPMVSPPLLGELPEFIESMSKAEYIQAVEKAKEYIRAGDIFQVVLAKAFSFEVNCSPIDVYRVLRQINPSPYMYYLDNPEGSLIGCSPEPLVKVQNSKVISRPIAGTRRRGETTEADLILEKNLKKDEKELAEHVMLVDLARNDLGRVVKAGSLNIDEMMSLERYSHVMHLTSQVSGELKDDVSLIDVIKATMPAGTVSGAPKVRAIEIINSLEKSARGPYAGMVGYLDFSKNMDSAITIRTMFFQDNKCYVQAGAGIVADSNPELENRECWNKASALLLAVKPAEELYKQRSNLAG